MNRRREITDLLPLFFLLFTSVSIFCCHAATRVQRGKVCLGTSNGAASPSMSSAPLYSTLERYANCSIVSGNLEITWIDHLVLDYLQEVVEVTGYVLIYHADVKRISLPKLRLIRGRSLYRDEFALYIGENSALMSIEMPSLGEILTGNVGVFNNRNLCHLDSINWDEIIANPKLAGYRQGYNLTKPAARRNCSPSAVGNNCHRSCEQRSCWAEGAHNCQRFSRLGCSDSCDKLGLRCFGPNSHQCCHSQCAVGCTGPRRTDCLACKHFDDDGTCKPKCPRRHKLNKTTNEREDNPSGKYTYISSCVKDCPEGLLKDNDACVYSCPPKKYALKGECVWCEGVCPKICPGSPEINPGNIFNFENCTIIDGSIGIVLDEIKPEHLEVFATVNKITGYLHVEGEHRAHKDLSGFRNLETIGGQALTKRNASLYIAGTSLTALGLRSLKRIESGNVVFTDNKNLCYADTINWDRMQQQESAAPEVSRENLLSGNRNGTDCRHLICDEQCSDDGCWGPGPHHCRSCKNFVLKGVCVKDCKYHGSYQADDKTCKKCHKDCYATCTGPKLEDCVYPTITSKAQCQKVIDTCSKI